ncbi:hypothetical protein BN133_4141 [Cronobacter dublinensis 582]|nr:hypothetical protein BN133_4141 [Cronobacter dublinensis 582]
MPLEQPQSPGLICTWPPCITTWLLPIIFIVFAERVSTPPALNDIAPPAATVAAPPAATCHAPPTEVPLYPPTFVKSAPPTFNEFAPPM